MAHRQNTDRIEEQGLIAGVVLILFIAFSLAAVASVYFGIH